MTEKKNWPKVELKDGRLTVFETTNIELMNPDIVNRLLGFSYCELKKDSEGMPILVYSKKISALVPSTNDIEEAQKSIEESKTILMKTDYEVERIKIIVELLKEKAGSEDKK